MELILASITDVITPAVGDEEGGWIQLLVFAAVGAFLLLGNIAKARADKAEAARREERQAARPKPQPHSNAAQERQRAARRARLEQEMRQRQAQAQAARAQQKDRLLHGYKRPQQKKPRPIPTTAPERKPVQDLLQLEAPKLKSLTPTAKPVLKSTTSTAPASAKQVYADPELPQFIGVTGEPDDLRTAVLYHEILGMPLALREEWLNLSKY